MRHSILIPSLARTRAQLETLIGPDAVIMGPYAHAITTGTAIQPRHIFSLRYGDGQLARSLAKIDVTHMIFDVDGGPRVVELFARDGVHLEELDRTTIHGAEVALFRVPDTGATRTTYEEAHAAATEGDRDRAIELYRTLLGRTPDCAAAWTALGDLFEESEDLERAHACWREAIAHDPARAAAHISLARLYVANGYRDDAAWHMARASAAAPALEPKIEELRRKLAQRKLSQRKSAETP